MSLSVGQSEWAAPPVSVWGGGSRATYQPTDAEERSECFVCYGEKANATFVRFKPCSHSACLECVQTLRASNIFKVRSARVAREQHVVVQGSAAAVIRSRWCVSAG